MKIIKSKKVLKEILLEWLPDRTFVDSEEEFVLEDFLDVKIGFNCQELTPRQLLDACKLFGWGNVAIEFEQFRSGTDTIYFHVKEMPQVKEDTWMPFKNFDEFSLVPMQDGRVWFRLWWD